MKIKLLLLLAFFFAICYNQSWLQTIDPGIQDGKLFVIIRENSSVILEDYKGEGLPANPDLVPFVNLYGLSGIRRPFLQFKGPACKRTYEFSFTKYTEADKFITSLQKLDYVETAEKAPLYFISLTPNDPYFNSGNYHPQNWHLERIGAESAWNINQGSASVQIAIVDNEIDYQHPDLFANIHELPSELPVGTWPNGVDGPPANTYIDDLYGWDITDNDLNTTGNNLLDHGTHCAGLASAVTNNSVGISSIGNTCEIIPLKVASNSSAIPTQLVAADCITAIYYAVDNGAEVISCSWGGGHTTALQNAILYANTQGVVVVAAAGNMSTSTAPFPAGYASVIAVAATDPDDLKAGFSNFGAWVDICAPGTNIFSTNSRTIPNTINGYSYKSGTSMSCPIVAGLCGLILSQNPGFTPLQVLNCLQSTATNIDAINPTYAGQLGAGRINAPQALLCANNNQSAFFIADITNACMNQTINLSGLSNATGITGWSWSFTPAPATITPGPTSQNVSVTFSNAAQVSVTLTVTTATNTYTYTQNNYLNIDGPSANFVSPSVVPICNGSAQTLVVGFQNGVPPFTYTISNGYTTQTINTSVGANTNPLLDYFYFNADPNYPNYTISSLTDANGCTGVNNPVANLTIVPCCANLINNGDFELGNTPSIGSDNYILCVIPTGTDGEGCASVMDCDIATLPNLGCNSTVGVGSAIPLRNLYWGANGRKGNNENAGINMAPLAFSTPAFNPGFTSRLWYQQNVNVTSGSLYNLEFLFHGAYGSASVNPFPAVIRVEIVDASSVVLFSSGNFVAPVPNNDWHQMGFAWNNTGYTGTVEVRILQADYFAATFYDFAFDDISLRKTNITAGNGGAFAGQNITVCAGTTVQLSGSGGPSYSWSPGSYTVAQPTVTPASTTTYTLTVNNAGCGTSTDQVTINVVPFICPGASNVGAATFNGSNNLGILSATTISVTGNITFNSGANTIDCDDVRMAPGVKMIVKNGASLTIRNAWIHGCAGCGSLWEGIEVEHGGTLSIYDNSVIEDANNAVKTVASASGSIPNLSISNMIFNKNRRAIYIANATALDLTPNAGNVVKNCIFTSRVITTSPTAGNFNTIKNALYNNTGTYATTNMINGMRPQAGFWVDVALSNANGYEIGAAGATTGSGGGNINIFDNLDFGINVTAQGNFYVYNNMFINITGNSTLGNVNANPYITYPFGVGVSITGGGSSFAGIGGSAGGASANGFNVFKNCNRAVSLYGHNYAYFYNNTVTNDVTSPVATFTAAGYRTGQYGFYISPDGSEVNANLQVKNNSILNVAYGVHINRSSAYSGNNYRIECNTISSGGTQSQYLKKGVYLQDAVGSTTGMPQYGINVRYNTITFAEEKAFQADNVKCGIDISSNNEWSVKYTSASLLYPNTVDVIRLNNCEGVKIEANAQFRTSGGNTVVSNTGITGIYVNNVSATGNNNKFIRNTISNVGNCFVFAGSNASGTDFRSNIMQNSNTGMYMYTSASFNTQGGVNVPTGNRWGTTGSGSLVWHTRNASFTNVNNTAKIYVLNPSGSGSLTGTPTVHGSGLLSPAYTIGAAASNGFIYTGGTEPTYGTCLFNCGCNGGDPQGFQAGVPDENTVREEVPVFNINRLAFDNTVSSVYDDERKWYNRLGAMQLLVADNRKLDTKELYDFYNNEENATFRSFSMVDKYLEKGDFEMARKELFSIVPKNTIEENLYFVDEQIIFANTGNLDAGNTGVLSQLLDLGNECSVIAGPAVYKARALYNHLTKGSFSFSENCPEPTPGAINPTVDIAMHSVYFNLYPNPNDGKMTIEYELLPDVKAELVIYDVNGRLVWKKYVDPQINVARVDIGDVAEGIYMYKLEVNGEIVESNRFIVVK